MVIISDCKREIRYQNRAANSSFYCDICDRNFTAEFYYKSHMQGRPHAAKLREKFGDPQHAKTRQPCLVLWYCGKCDSHMKLFRKQGANNGVDITLSLCAECDALNQGIHKMFK